ncbi:hypothetical protein ACWGLC_12890 [Dietzia sp. NPDC055877]
MRSQSGPRNRVVLLVLGVLALVAAAWLAAAAFDLVPAGGTLDPLVPDGASTPASLLEDAGWALPVGIAVSVVAVLAGLALLITQIPTAPARAVLRLHDPEGAVLATLEPQVLERALVERVEDVQGVDSASVRATGSATRAGVVAEVTVAESAEIAWTLEQVRRRLFEDLRLSLGVEPRSVDVLVSLRAAKNSARTDRVAVGGEKE